MRYSSPTAHVVDSSGLDGQQALLAEFTEQQNRNMIHGDALMSKPVPFIHHIHK
jgi:hypothetical protein